MSHGRSRPHHPSSPIYTDIPQAPFKIGALVKVCLLADEMGKRWLLGRTGKAEYFEYNCGCGQSYPKDPMIGVRFAETIVEEFWREELEHKISS